MRSLVTLRLNLTEIEWRKKKKELQEEDEFEDLTEEAKTLQEQELEKVCDRRPPFSRFTFYLKALSDPRFCGHSDQVQPGPSDPEGGEGESRPFQEEDAVIARQNAHARQ